MTTMRARLLTYVLVLPLLAAIAGCSAGHDGRFLVVVSSDVPSPDPLATVRVESGGEVHDFPLSESTRLPFSFALDARPGRPDDEPVTFVVSGLDPSGAVLVSRPVVATFQPNRTLVLPVALARRCTPLARCAPQLRCDADEACTPDGCDEPEVGSEELGEIRTPGEEVGASITPLEACQVAADFRCAAALRCCSMLGDRTDEEREIFRSECVTALREACTSMTVPILEDPRTAFDPARAAAALEVGASLARACSVDLARWSNSSERGILSALRGTVPLGGACSFDDTAGVLSCRDGACLPERATLDPVCAAESCLGETCFDSNGILEFASVADLGCADGLYCSDGGAGPATCSSRLPEGASCDRDAQCESSICDRPAGTCTDGRACELGSQCGPGRCDLASGTCHDGATCTSDLACTYRDCRRELGVCRPLTVDTVYCG